VAILFNPFPTCDRQLGQVDSALAQQRLKLRGCVTWSLEKRDPERPQFDQSSIPASSSDLACRADDGFDLIAEYRILLRR
jgi:hypothetical protein